MNITAERQIGEHVYTPTATELAAEDLCSALGTELQPAETTDTLLQEWPHLIRYSPWGEAFRGKAMIRVEYYRQPPRTEDLEWRHSHLLHQDGDKLQPPEIRAIMESAPARRAILLDPAAYPPSIERLREFMVADVFDVSGSGLTHEQIKALSDEAYIKFCGDRRVLALVYDRPAILHRPVPGMEGRTYDIGRPLDILRITDSRRGLPEQWVGHLVSSQSRELGIPLIGLEYRFPAEVAPGQVTNLMASLLEDHITRLNAS